MNLDDGYVPIDNFGADHWSTLGYAETVMVESGGFQVGFDPRMRQGRRHFRVMQEQCPKPKRPSPGAYGVVMESKHSTPLRDGTVVDGHDDWHCIQDMINAGLLGTKKGREIVADPNACEPKAMLHLTELGREITNQLRAHKAAGGRWRDFAPKLPVTA